MTPFKDQYVAQTDNTRVDRTNIQYQEQPDRRWVQQGDFLVNTETGERKINALPLGRVYPEFEIISGLVGGLSMKGAIKQLPKTKSGKSVKITSQNVLSMTDDQWDDAYNAAIKTGDVSEAQRLRDLHFKAKAHSTKYLNADGTPKIATHGTNKDFNSFQLEGEGIKHGDAGDYGYGHYFYPDKRVSTYGDRQIHAYLNIEKPYTGDWNRNFNRGQSGISTTLKNMRTAKEYGLYEATPQEMIQELNSLKNADGVFAYSPHSKRMQEVVVPKGEQIKLADAVTYDNRGNIIPLSKRDNFNINDIRYGLIPFIGTSFIGDNQK